MKAGVYLGDLRVHPCSAPLNIQGLLGTLGREGQGWDRDFGAETLGWEFLGLGHSVVSGTGDTRLGLLGRGLGRFWSGLPFGQWSGV